MLINDLKLLSGQWILENDVYLQFNGWCQVLNEQTGSRTLTDQEIQTVFDRAERIMQSQGTARTILGRSKDRVQSVAQSLTQGLSRIRNAISTSAPVEQFDQRAQQVIDRITGDLGSSPQIRQALQAYRNFATKHPRLQTAVLMMLIAAAGISGAGMSTAAVLAVLRATDRLLRGDKASSAAWSGFLSGAAALGLSQLLSPATAGVSPDALVATGSVYEILPGDTMSEIAQKFRVSIQDILDANPDLPTYVNAEGDSIVDVHKIYAGDEIRIPAATGNPVYQYNVGLGGPMPRGSAMENRDLNRMQIHRIVRNCSRHHNIQPLQENQFTDTLRGMGRQLTRKITREKLLRAWKRSGNVKRSDELAEFLVSQGVDPRTVSLIYLRLDIPLPTQGVFATRP